MKYKVIDNFFPKDVFNNFYEFLLPNPLEERWSKEEIHWCYNPSVVDSTKKGDEEWRLIYYTHLVYNHVIISDFYNRLVPHISSLNIKSLIRIKLNMYPNTEILKEHGMHIDYDFPHKAGILSMNTCNGYTKLKDGTKIDSVANRMLLFDASNPHTSSTCTNQPVRMNINFNYF